MRVIGLVRVVLGAVGALRPRTTARVWGLDPGSTVVRAVARFLGVRHVAQGVALYGGASRRVRAVSAAVDLLHGVSMVALAATCPRLRRAASLSAGVAFACAAGSSPRRGAIRADRADRVGRGDAADLGPGLAPPAGGAATPSMTSSSGDRDPSARGTARHRPVFVVASPGAAPSVQMAAAPGWLSEPVILGTIPDLEAGRTPEPELTHRRRAALERVAHRRAGWRTRRSHRLEAVVSNRPMPAWSPIAVWVSLVIGAWLLVGQGVLSYPFTVVGQNTGLRDSGFAVAVTLASLRLVVTPRSGPATGVLAVCGVLLVAAGLWSGHDSGLTQVNELTCGAVLAVASLGSLDHRPSVRSTRSRLSWSRR